MPGTRLGRRLLAALGIALSLGVLAVGALVGSLWLEHRAPVTLPTPTGPFAVGRAIYDWNDGAADSLAPAPGATRELLVWIWYPAEAGRQPGVDDYLPEYWRAAAERGEPAPFLWKWLTRDLSQVHAHSLRNAGVSPREKSYPVVIMRAGASREVAAYTTLAEDLASHGYVVVGFDAPYRTGLVVFPDGRVFDRTPENNPELYAGKDLQRVAVRLMAAWTGDIAFVLNRLAQLNASAAFQGRLDLTRVGVFGHSFGGATALEFCHQDARCKAGIDIDGAPFGSVIQEGLRQPFMFLLSGEGDFSTSEEIRRIKADIQSIYHRLPPDQRFQVVIRGANHFTFSDDGALLKSHLLRGVLRVFGQLGIDGPRQLAVTAYCVHRFFDHFLRTPGTSPLQLASPRYPEIQVLE